MTTTQVRAVSKDEDAFTERYIKPVRIPKKNDGIRNKKKKEVFEGKADEGLKPQHRPYVRCPTSLHNYLLDDDNE